MLDIKFKWSFYHYFDNAPEQMQKSKTSELNFKLQENQVEKISIPKNLISLMRNDLKKLHAKELEEDEEENKKISSNLKLIYDTG